MLREFGLENFSRVQQEVYEDIRMSERFLRLS